MTMTTEELEKETLDVIGKVMAQSRKIIDEQRMKIADLQAANKAMMLQANTDGGNAQPAQPSAWERLGEWYAKHGGAVNIELCLDDQYREYTTILLNSREMYEIEEDAATPVDAINAALDAAEGADHE